MARHGIDNCAGLKGVLAADSQQLHISRLMPSVGISICWAALRTSFQNKGLEGAEGQFPVPPGVDSRESRGRCYNQNQRNPQHPPKSIFEDFLPLPLARRAKARRLDGKPVRCTARRAIQDGS